jgi:type I restriction enzyme S subunit
MLHKADYVEDGVPLVNPMNIVGSRIVASPKMMVSSSTRERLANYVLRKGDVVIARRGELGRCAVVGEAEEGWICGTGSFFLRLSSRVDPEYFALLFRSDDLRAVLQENSIGTTMSNLNHGILNNLDLLLPPVEEQRRIVAILDEAFEGIAAAKANAERCLQSARSLFDGYLQSVFMQRGKLWVEKRLDEVSKFSSGGTPPKQNESYWGGKIPWVSGRDMKSTRLSDSVLHISQAAVDGSSTRMAPTGTLLILVRGMGLAHGAQVAELMAPCAFNQDIKGIHPEPSLISRFLLFALRERINSSDTILSNAAHGTLKIDSAELGGLAVPVPPREYQQRVVKTIDSLAEETQRLGSVYQRKLAALDALKQSLLHQAFSGNL